MHLTGHKSLEMVQRYAHLAPEYQEAAIAVLNQHSAAHSAGIDGTPCHDFVMVGNTKLGERAVSH